ncbi:MAG: DUF4266 domain-containing protein [Nannocystaceae bacterium]
MHSRSRSERLRLRTAAIGVALSLAPLLGGCARAVLPSEKAYLADPIMQFDPDALEASANAHVFSNREGAAGGTGTADGGCGCN